MGVVYRTFEESMTRKYEILIIVGALFLSGMTILIGNIENSQLMSKIGMYVGNAFAAIAVWDAIRVRFGKKERI